DRAAAGAVDVHFPLQTAKKMRRWKGNGVTDVIIPIPGPARRRAMQAHPGIVKHFCPIIDERAADESLAHHVGGVEHEIAIRIKLDEPQLMSGKLRALGVGHLVKRPGKWALGGSKCRSSERVLGGD